MPSWRTSAPIKVRRYVLTVYRISPPRVRVRWLLCSVYHEGAQLESVVRMNCPFSKRW